MNKKLLFRISCLAAIIAFGAVSYLSFEHLIRYEAYGLNADNTVSKTDTVPFSTPNALPQSEYYVLRTDGTSLLVYDAAEHLIYKQPLTHTLLSENDKSELERDGLRLTSRSDVLEMLYYLNS